MPLRAAGPAGRFTPAAAPSEQQRFLLIAGGVGITPIIALLKHWLSQASEARIRMIYCSRSRADAVFASELHAMESDPRLELHWHFDDEAGVMTASGFEALVGGWNSADAFLCGPEGLMTLAEGCLRALGLPLAQIHSERFLVARRATRPTTAQHLFFVRSKREVIQEPGETILQAALRAGLDLPYSCTMGGCAHCRQHVAGGKGAIVMDQPNCLTPPEIDAGAFLACCGFATETVHIDA